MTVADVIYQQVKTMPPPLAREVLDFVEFLQAKPREAQVSISAETAVHAVDACFGALGKGRRTEAILQELRDKP